MSLLASIAGSAVGGILGSRSAKKAAKYQAAAMDRATAEQRRQYDTSRADLQPWRQTGSNALARLDRASSGDMSDFHTSPDYQFRRDEGTRDIGNFFASGPSGVYSGNAMRALTDFNSGLAAGEYGNWWGRQFGLSESGRGAATTTGHLGQQSANNISNLMVQKGNAQANGAYNSGAAINNAVQQGIGNYLYSSNRWPKQPKSQNVYSGNQMNPEGWY